MSMFLPVAAWRKCQLQHPTGKLAADAHEAVARSALWGDEMFNCLILGKQQYFVGDTASQSTK